MEHDIHTTPFKVGLKYGAILGIAMSVLGLIFHYAGLNDDPLNTSITQTILTTGLSWVILFVGFFFGIKYFKQANEGHLTFGEGLITSLFIGVISGIISAIFSFIFFSYVAPDLASSLSEAALEGAKEGNPEIDAEGEEMMNNMMSTIMSPGVMAAIGFVTRIFTAVIFGIIGTLIQKTE